MIPNQELSKDGLSSDEKTIDVLYRQAIGSLLYVSNGTRPDISFAVNKLASFSNCVKTSHWTAVERTLSYLKDTTDIGLHFKANNNELVAYSDSDFAGDVDTKRSTSVVLLMLNEAPIVWKSSKQSTVATSTTNAEFVSASVTSSEIIWTRQFLEELGRSLVKPTILHIDNQSAN